MAKTAVLAMATGGKANTIGLYQSITGTLLGNQTHSRINTIGILLRPSLPDSVRSLGESLGYFDRTLLVGLLLLRSW